MKAEEILVGATYFRHALLGPELRTVVAIVAGRVTYDGPDGRAHCRLSNFRRWADGEQRRRHFEALAKENR